MRTSTIGVKQGAEVKQRTVDVEYTHHGPVVARKGGKAYTIAIPYMEQVGLGDQVLRNDESAQSRRDEEGDVIAPVDGTECHGRPRSRATSTTCVTAACRSEHRASTSRPIPGNTSANEWRGIHPLSDLIQVTNPPNGWMQNCNCSPAAMMPDSPMVPEKYRALPYLFNVGSVLTHQRAQMMNDLLAAADKVTFPRPSTSRSIRGSIMPRNGSG